MIDSAEPGDSAQRALSYEGRQRDVPIDQGIDRFVKSIPDGDVIVIGEGAALTDFSLLAAHDRAVLRILDPNSATRSADDSSIEGSIVHRSLSSDARLPYPPGVFAGCWLNVPTGGGLSVAPTAAMRLVRAGGVLALQEGDRVSLSERPSDGTSAREHPDCLLCPELRFYFNRSAKLPGAAGILWGDADIYVIPDIAPVALGHVLIVSMDHYLCAAALPERVWDALTVARKRVADLYQKIYGTAAIFFEHGPAQPGEGGVCIDHAHWHCIPARSSLRPVLDECGMRGGSATIETLRDMHGRGDSYLYLEEQGTGWAYANPRVPNQFLRWAAMQAESNTTQAGPARRWRWMERVSTAVSQELFSTSMKRMLSSLDSPV